MSDVIGGRLDRWYVVFVDADRVWFHRLMKPGFRHCFAFAWDEDADRWIVLEPGFDGVLVRPIRDEAAIALWTGLHASGAHVLLARMEGHGLYRPRLMLTCVSAIAAVLALRRCCAVSPWQLYRSLLARGAVEVFGR